MDLTGDAGASTEDIDRKQGNSILAALCSPSLDDLLDLVLLRDCRTAAWLIVWIHVKEMSLVS